MEILVANPSYQTVRFEYRVPEYPQPFRRDILAGIQVRLAPGDFNETQVKEVIEQLERFGAVPNSEIRSMALVAVGAHPIRKPMVFSIETPIKENKLNEAREADESIRQQVADREAEAAGCATIPPNLDPRITRAMRETQQESSLHIEQIQDLETERGQKGGVNKTITVSKKAGERQRKVG